jgi:hypothetical protein
LPQDNRQRQIIAGTDAAYQQKGKSLEAKEQ